MKKVLLLLIVASHISGSEPLDLSLIPRSYNQALPVLGLDTGRRPTRFEQGIAKLAAKKIEKIFNEQDAAASNLLMLPFELQIIILDRLSIVELARFALVNREYRKLVDKYRAQVTELDLSDYSIPSLTPSFIQEIALQYPAVKRLVTAPIFGGNIVKLLKAAFPQLEVLQQKVRLVDLDNLVDQVFSKWLTKRNYNF